MLEFEFTTTTLVGLTAAAVSCVIALPQLWRTLGHANLSGVSSATWWLTLINSALWALWALLADAPIAGIPSLVTGPAAAFILYRLYRDRRARAAAVAAVDDNERENHVSGKGTTGADWCPWCFSWAPYGVDGRYGEHPSVGSPKGGEPPAPGECPLVGEIAPPSRIRRVVVADR